MCHFLLRPTDQLLNGGVQGLKTYSETVPWLEWLTFKFAENDGPAVRYKEVASIACTADEEHLS